MTMILGPEERGRPREWWGSGAKTKMLLLLLLLWSTVRTWTRWCDHNDEATAFLYSVLNRFHPLHFTCKSTTPLLDILGIFGALQSVLFLFRDPCMHLKWGALCIPCSRIGITSSISFRISVWPHKLLVSRRSSVRVQVAWGLLNPPLTGKPIPPISIHTLESRQCANFWQVQRRFHSWRRCQTVFLPQLYE